MPEAVLQHVLPFLLVVTRLGGLFLLAPILSSVAVPRQVRAVLLLGLAAAVYPTVPVHGQVPVELSLYELAPLVVRESLIGVVLGLVALLPFAAVQLAGLIMGQQVGLAFAQVVNPAADIEGDALGQFLFHVALATFLLMGGLEALVDALVRSFALVPLGGIGPERLPVQEVAGLLTSGLHLAFRLSMPVLLIILIENVVIGFTTKTMPSLNIMSVGFPIRILLGLGVLVASMGFVGAVINADVSDTIDQLHGWVDSLGEPVPERSAV